MQWSKTSSPKPASAERLLDEGLRWALKGLALPRRRSLGVVEGAHLGARGGRGEDFFQHRAYVAGEDLRTVDFRASARSEHLLVKELHRPLRQPLVVVVDASASMGLWGKRRCALQVGAAVAVLAQRRGDPVSLVALGGERLELIGRMLASAQPSLAVEALFGAVPEAGRAELWGALAGPMPVALAGAHLVLLSDLYGEPARAGAVLAQLASRTGAVTVLHVLAPGERRLPEGVDRLRDVETGEELPVSAEEVEAFGARVGAWRDALRAGVTGRGGEWRDVDASVPVGLTLREWLA